MSKVKDQWCSASTFDLCLLTFDLRSEATLARHLAARAGRVPRPREAPPLASCAGRTAAGTHRRRSGGRSPRASAAPRSLRGNVSVTSACTALDERRKLTIQFRSGSLTQVAGWSNLDLIRSLAYPEARLGMCRWAVDDRAIGKSKLGAMPGAHDAAVLERTL